jgi:hypothetical protein
MCGVAKQHQPWVHENDRFAATTPRPTLGTSSDASELPSPAYHAQLSNSSAVRSPTRRRRRQAAEHWQRALFKDLSGGGSGSAGLHLQSSAADTGGGFIKSRPGTFVMPPEELRMLEAALLAQEDALGESLPPVVPQPQPLSRTRRDSDSAVVDSGRAADSDDSNSSVGSRAAVSAAASVHGASAVSVAVCDAPAAAGFSQP